MGTKRAPERKKVMIIDASPMYTLSYLHVHRRNRAKLNITGNRFSSLLNRDQPEILSAAYLCVAMTGGTWTDLKEHDRSEFRGRYDAGMTSARSVDEPVQ